jgi:CheY-like chemotaxis protein
LAREILVVDDDHTNLEMLAELLREEGYAVEGARDGYSALDHIERKRPGLVVLDWFLPRLDAARVAEEMGRRGLRPAIPLLLLTGHARGAACAETIKAEGFLPKPFDLDEFLSEVVRLAGTAGPGAPPPDRLTRAA